MNLLQKPLSLLEIEEMLENEFRDDQKGIRIIGDLDLTYEDYCFLELKAKGLQRYSNNMVMVEKYRFVVLTTWVFALRYGNLDKINMAKVSKKFTSLQQHIMRKSIHIISETFDEFGLNTYGQNTYTLEGLLTAIGLHAGIPTNVQERLFTVLEESMNYQDMNRFEQQLKFDLEPRLSMIFSYVGSKMTRKILLEYRDIFLECRLNNVNIEQLLERYMNVSKGFIENLVRWCEEMDYNNTHSQKQLMYK
ncbi:hypothetical protein [Anaerosporobacter faecicola]|uniref:hypothetical protein n=1 Tax=Anaerosporobacter faecicola TaxID=2718714 RepID=UPI00143AA997|nr:hypothetical protein [Anaerosporobacter faecicola]